MINNTPTQNATNSASKFLRTFFIALLSLSMGITGISSASAAGSAENSILTFSASGATGVVSEVDHTVTVEVPFGTDLTTLAPTFTASADSTVEVGATPQVSGTTVNDFTTAVNYTVTAQDGTDQVWVVTITAAAGSAENSILTFSASGATGVVSEVDHTVTVEVPFGTDLTTLAPTFTASADSTVEVGATPQVSGTTVNDFTTAVNYTVTAQDGTDQVWVVTITAAAAVTPPDAPTSLTATAGDGQAIIAFTAPASNGGASIINYQYSTDGTTYTALSTPDATTPITISGLTNGTAYTITLKAVNSAGASVASSPVSVTPAAAPVNPPSGPSAAELAAAAAARAAAAKAAADKLAAEKVIADAKLAAEAAVAAAAKEAADKVAAEKANAERVAAEAVATAKAEAKARAKAKAAANTVKISSSASGTKLSLNLADKYYGEIVQIYVGTTRNGKTTFVLVDDVVMEKENGAASITIKRKLSKGQVLRFNAGKKVITSIKVSK
ncbi:Fibronectin type III [Candidatus Nanopelagicaceae bacterium]